MAKIGHKEVPIAFYRWVERADDGKEKFFWYSEPFVSSSDMTTGWMYDYLAQKTVEVALFKDESTPLRLCEAEVFGRPRRIELKLGRVICELTL